MLYDETFALLCDFYELTMANGYLQNEKSDTVAYFDLFFRQVPDKGAFAIFCGLSEAVDYLKNLSFTEDDIQYLRDKGMFSPEFIDYLENFKFCCDVWSVPEGTPVFPGEIMLYGRYGNNRVLHEVFVGLADIIFSLMPNLHKGWVLV